MKLAAQRQFLTHVARFQVMHQLNIQYSCHCVLQIRYAWPIVWIINFSDAAPNFWETFPLFHHPFFHIVFKSPQSSVRSQWIPCKLVKLLNLGCIRWPNYWAVCGFVEILQVATGLGKNVRVLHHFQHVISTGRALIHRLLPHDHFVLFFTTGRASGLLQRFQYSLHILVDLPIQTNKSSQTIAWCKRVPSYIPIPSTQWMDLSWSCCCYK